MANFRSSSPGVKFVGFTSALPSVQDWSISPKIFPDHGCLFYDLWHTHLAFQWITILVFEHIQNYFQRKIWAFALWPIFTGGEFCATAQTRDSQFSYQNINCATCLPKTYGSLFTQHRISAIQVVNSLQLTIISFH